MGFVILFQAVFNRDFQHDKIELNCHGTTTPCKIHSYSYLRIYDCTSTCVKRDHQPKRIPAEIPHVCNERIKSYYRHTYPSLQSLVPTLSPLLVRFPSVSTFRLIPPVCLLQQLLANTSLVSRSPLPSARTI